MFKLSKQQKLPADLYSRNSFYNILINHFLGSKKRRRVLDVGGYEGKLHWFVGPNIELTVTDVKGQNGANNHNYIQADATKLPFKDGEFDLVISSDLMEHLPAEKRKVVYQEMLRVSSRFLIIGAPFKSHFVEKAEEIVNNIFTKYTKGAHPFLKEHAEFGLPETEELEMLMAGKNLSFEKFGEGNIYNWVLMQLSIGSMTGELKDLRESILNQYFNQNLQRLGNFRSPTYRTVYCIDQKSKIDKSKIQSLIEKDNNFHTTAYFELFSHAFEELRTIIDLKNSDIRSEQEKIIEDFEKIEALQARISVEQEQNAEKDSEINLLNTQLSESQSVINEIETEIHQIKNNNSKLNDQLRIANKTASTQESLIKKLRDKNTELAKELSEVTSLTINHEQKLENQQKEMRQLLAERAEMARSHAEYKKELETVISSRSWRMVKFYGKFKEKLYLKPKNYLERSVYILTRMGPKEFFTRLYRKLTPTRKVEIQQEYQQYVYSTKVSKKQLKQRANQIENFNYKPLISLLVPVYNVEETWLRKCIESVQKQIYPKWELCMVDDGSDQSHIKNILKEYADKDSRIRIKYSEKNGGIVKASNQALKMAKGAYIGLLDNDDELTFDALYEVVKSLQKTKYDLIYSDEDKLELDGTRCDAYFKPDYSPDLLLSNNYICHFGVYRRKIVEAVGGFREGTDGSQDYDLVLRFTDKKRKIHHIPKILYHWRKIPGSTATSVNEKSYAYVAGKKAIEDALKRRNIDAEVLEGKWKGSYRVKRRIEGKPLVSIIIPFRDKAEYLKVALNSLFEKTTYQNYEIILINNQSELLETKQYLRALKNCPRVKIYDYDHPFNYSSINNFAAKKSKGEYLILLNNDTEIISPEWIEAMLEHAQRLEVGAVSAKLLFPNNSVQHAGVLVGVGGLGNHAFLKQPAESHGYFGNLDVIRNYSAVTAACMMVRRKLYFDMGGLNENELAVSFNDLDFCLRLREKGYLIVYTPFAELYHHESLSRGYYVCMNEEHYMRKRHFNILKKGDPYYNPNLSRERLDFSLRVSDKIK
ncbi:glycosyltransferase [Candidatus Peregrinibacteria bacterium]|nr:glycosyltransferase [Candidatus Peregrinibacteria bacterium]